MAQLVKSKLLPAQHQEQLIFMDIFGKRMDVFLNLSTGPARADKVSTTIAAMNASEASITAYASANEIDLTANLAAGAAALAEMQTATF